MNPTAGKFLYALLFVVLLPLALMAWAREADPNVSLPPIQAKAWGWVFALPGGLLMVAGMVSLWLFGKGLPMNAYPPSRYVSRGVYRLVRHPIYLGFALVCAGMALMSGSASGLWLVCPAVILSMAALVLGYENIDLQIRFGRQLPQPVLCLASAGDMPPSLAERGSVYFLVFLPWLLLYEWLALRGVPADAIIGFLPFEKNLPVLEWTELLYAGTYAAVLLVPWVAPSKKVLREFSLQAWFATFLMPLFFVALPLSAPPRPIHPQTFLGRLLLVERSFDTPSNAFPSYHVFWALLAMSVFTRRMPRTRCLWWSLGAVMSLSCLTTGMHGLLDVIGGVALYFLARNMGAFWEGARRAAERVANSWQEWQWGGVRIINHGLYAGIGSALGVGIVGSLLGSTQAISIFLVAGTGLVTAALWAQLVEGSPSLLRPYGYYGGVLGVILGSVFAQICFGTNPWLLLAGYCVAGPWVQSFGRLRCLVQGCCHGREAPPGLGIIYRHPRSRVCRLAGLQERAIHPTPLYSILWNIPIAVLMTRLWFAHASLAVIGGLYLILSGVGRFVEEAYRGEPQTRSIAGLRSYQWIAVFTVVAGAAVTCARTVSATGRLNFSILNLTMALTFGVVAWFALGVDFPRSDRRFARLV